jgi:hypothetical protein
MAAMTRALARSKTTSAILGAALLGSVVSVVETAGPAAAQMTYTPDTSGYHELDVSATAVDGTILDTYYYGFVVN